MDFSAPQIVSLTQYWTCMVLVWTCMARARILLRIDLSRSFLAVGLRQKAYSVLSGCYLWSPLFSSSETQGQLAGARGNKSGKATKCPRFTSQAKKAPGNRLLPDHFQTALPLLPPDWAEKSFVLFCPIGEQQLLRYCNVFLHDDFRITLLAWFVH